MPAFDRSRENLSAFPGEFLEDGTEGGFLGWAREREDVPLGEDVPSGLVPPEGIL